MVPNAIFTDKAPQPVGPYSQAIVASGPLVFVAGQIALDPQTGEIVGVGNIEQQTHQVLKNLQAILEASGTSFSGVVKTTIFLANMNDFGTVNGIYAQYFSNGAPPARACVEVARLPKDVLVEIDCIAVLSVGT